MNLKKRSARADLRLFRSALGDHLFVADGSRIYDIEQTLARQLDPLLDEHDADDVWALLGLEGRATRKWIDERPSPVPPLSSISLNVAQACNMACSYCYADQGHFGGKARLMSLPVAQRAVDRLIAEAAPGSDLLIGFMGGEPLLNRHLINQIVIYATEQGTAAGHSVRFSITTNATLLTDADAQLFSRYPFCVQVSVDGPGSINDLQRPMQDGSGSYTRVLEGIKLLRRYEPPRQLSARVTVTSQSGGLLPILDHLIALGFDDVGFAVVLVSPNSAQQMQEEDFGYLLPRMIDCGRKCIGEIKAGRNYPFTNFLTAMQEIHRGTHRPYPCGAAGAYLSVNADGRFFACHRLIDDDAFAMGNVWAGSDRLARQQHLRQSHVDRIQPCQTCWARYLCGGGCYHEVSKRGRVGCNFIRGWLEFCLEAYAELSASLPYGFQLSKIGVESEPIR